MDADKIANEHAEWTGEFCKWVYKQAWKHARKHTLEEIGKLWDDCNDSNFKKEFGDELYKLTGDK